MSQHVSTKQRWFYQGFVDYNAQVHQTLFKSFSTPNEQGLTVNPSNSLVSSSRGKKKSTPNVLEKEVDSNHLETSRFLLHSLKESSWKRSTHSRHLLLEEHGHLLGAHARFLCRHRKVAGEDLYQAPLGVVNGYPWIPLRSYN